MAKKQSNEDLRDSLRDQKELKSEEVSLDLPDVEDIPGQEHIHPPTLREYMDTTVSSDDEEGKGIVGLDDSLDAESNVDTTERALLDQAFEDASEDDKAVRDMTLDDVDNEGETLNEKGLEEDLFGEDLDSDLTTEEEEEDEGEK